MVDELIYTEVLLGFYRFHPVMKAEALCALRTLTVQYEAGSWLHANRYIQDRIKEIQLAHGGKVEELDRRLANSKLPWTTDPGYQPLFNTDLVPKVARLLSPLVVPWRTGIDCSPQSRHRANLPLGENTDTYPGMP